MLSESVRLVMENIVKKILLLTYSVTGWCKMWIPMVRVCVIPHSSTCSQLTPHSFYHTSFTSLGWKNDVGKVRQWTEICSDCVHEVSLPISDYIEIAKQPFHPYILSLNVLPCPQQFLSPLFSCSSSDKADSLWAILTTELDSLARKR